LIIKLDINFIFAIKNVKDTKYINMKRVLFFFVFINLILNSSKSQNYIIEPEGFENKGGWVVDQQNMDQIGSPYLMAHGYGIPVEDANTEFHVKKESVSRIWVRTRNWLAPWKETEAPGVFKIKVNENLLTTNFGTNGKEWAWQDGGVVKLKKGKNKLVLHDLTGFNGRCDAIFFSSELSKIPSNDIDDIAKLRKRYSFNNDKILNGGQFDLVVVGGGIAGICTAISAARLGCKVALINDRPVLGGNNSSEVRVGLSGLIFKPPYENLGKVVDEIGSVGHWTLWEAERDPESERSKKILAEIARNPEKRIHNAGPESNYGDSKKYDILVKESNIKLFLNTRVNGVEVKNGQIISVTGSNIENSNQIKFRSTLFVDCTGDGALGYLAGADYREGRESKSETFEPRSPQKSDNLVMGTSVQWYADKENEKSSFPEIDWGIQFSEKSVQKLTRGEWDWETGIGRNHVTEIEYIRDYGLLTLFSNWSFLKNKAKDKTNYENYKLKWVAFIGGKRESRRLLGDLILTENDILNKVHYNDATFTTTWGVDLHYPKIIDDFNGEPFLSWADIKHIEPYAVPYRCLYSRNVSNLFMAGRNISVTHVALGTIRVMRTTGMMGEVVGMAASICKNKKVLPRDIYTQYFDDLKVLMKNGVKNQKFND
jgi:hypothetical protein